MALPQIPLPVIIALPFLFIFLILFTDIRYEFRPNKYIRHGTTIAALSIGFVFLYALQKYDKMDANFPVVVRNIIYLADLALVYDPTLICYLIEYLNNFLTFDNIGYPIVIFEKKLLRQISDENIVFRVRESVSILEDISNQRVSGENLIAAPIWWVVFIAATILTILFPMDTNFESEIDAILIIIIIWAPVVMIYWLYMSILNDLEVAIGNLRDDLIKVSKRKKINCCKVMDDMINRGNIGFDSVPGFR